MKSLREKLSKQDAIRAIRVGKNFKIVYLIDTSMSTHVRFQRLTCYFSTFWGHSIKALGLVVESKKSLFESDI